MNTAEALKILAQFREWRTGRPDTRVWPPTKAQVSEAIDVAIDVLKKDVDKAASGCLSAPVKNQTPADIGRKGGSVKGPQKRRSKDHYSKISKAYWKQRKAKQ